MVGGTDGSEIQGQVQSTLMWLCMILFETVAPELRLCTHCWGPMKPLAISLADRQPLSFGYQHRRGAPRYRDGVELGQQVCPLKKSAMDCALL